MSLTWWKGVAGWDFYAAFLKLTMSPLHIAWLQNVMSFDIWFTIRLNLSTICRYRPISVSANRRVGEEVVDESPCRRVVSIVTQCTVPRAGPPRDIPDPCADQSRSFRKYVFLYLWCVDDLCGLSVFSKSVYIYIYMYSVIVFHLLSILWASPDPLQVAGALCIWLPATPYRRTFPWDALQYWMMVLDIEYLGLLPAIIRSCFDCTWLTFSQNISQNLPEYVYFLTWKEKNDYWSEVRAVFDIFETGYQIRTLSVRVWTIKITEWNVACYFLLMKINVRGTKDCCDATGKVSE